MEVNLRVNNANNDGIVSKRSNPFKALTNIGFELPSSMDASLTFTDIAGRTLKVINRKFNKGYNVVEINKMS